MSCHVTPRLGIVARVAHLSSVLCISLGSALYISGPLGLACLGLACLGLMRLGLVSCGLVSRVLAWSRMSQFRSDVSVSLSSVSFCSAWSGLASAAPPAARPTSPLSPRLQQALEQSAHAPSVYGLLAACPVPRRIVMFII